MFYMPDHYRWYDVRSPSEKNAGAGNSRNILRFERTHELLNRDLLLSEALCYRDRPLMPDEHHPIDECGQKQRNITALSKLGEIREEETCIDAEEYARDCSASDQAPAPDIAHRDKQQPCG